MNIITPSIEIIEGILAAQSDTPNKRYESAIDQYMRGGLSNRGSSLKTGVIKSPFSSILYEAYAYFGSSGGKRENEEMPVIKNNAQIESNKIKTTAIFKFFFILSLFRALIAGIPFQYNYIQKSVFITSCNLNIPGMHKARE
jgi:hypothetical protein